jgi:predicted AlkP superfamily phosphohydrolase/phosphomutase
MTRRRVAAIGLDALEWSEMERLVESGAMPNVGKLLSSASIARLTSPLPFRAEAVWTEFFTGRNREENRYWTTAMFDPGTYETWEQGAYRGAPFYARPDVVPVVFDLPHVPIAPEGRGLQITGWGAHSPQFPTVSLPSNIVPEIDRQFGVNKAMKSDSHAGWHNPSFQRALTGALIDGIKAKADIVPWLLERQPDWDMLLTVFTEPHVTGHQFWHGIDPNHMLYGTPHGERALEYHERVMHAVDQGVGDILGLLPDDVDVVLMAIHGMQSNGSDVTGNVFISELLHRWHVGRPLIDFGDFDPSAPPIVLPPGTLPIWYLSDRLLEARASMRATTSTGRAARRLVGQLRRHAPAAVGAAENAYRRVGGNSAGRAWWELVERPAAQQFTDIAAATARTPLDYQVPCWYRHRWPEMRSFVLPAFSDAHIRINLAGRESRGNVPLSEYVRTLDETEALIRECTDARTGEPIVAHVARPRECDPFDPDGPTSDLVVAFTRESDAIRHPKFGVIGPAPLMRSGEHSADGWVARAGTRRVEIDRTFAPRDLGPTMLDLAGLPPSPIHTGASFARFLA